MQDAAVCLGRHADGARTLWVRSPDEGWWLRAALIADLRVGIVAGTSAAAVFEMTAAMDRSAQIGIAIDLTAPLGPCNGLLPRSYCLRLRSLAARGDRPRRPVIRIALCNGLLRRLLLAYIVIVERRAPGTADLAALVAVSPVPVITDQRADARRLELDRIKRTETGNFGVQYGRPLLR
jgi:hypothetical protein